MKWLAALAVFLALPASAQMWPSPGPGHASYGSASYTVGEFSVNEDGISNGTTFGITAEAGVSAWTMSVWIKPAALTANMGVLETGCWNNNKSLAVNGASANDPVYISVTNSNNTKNKKYTYDSKLTQDVWTNIIFAFDGTTLKAYFDGTLTTKTASSQDDTGIIQTDLVATVGFAAASAGCSGTTYFNGRIANIGVWSVYLTDAEAAAVYARKLGTLDEAFTNYAQQANLVHWWPICRTATSTVTALADYGTGTARTLNDAAHNFNYTTDCVSEAGP